MAPAQRQIALVAADLDLLAIALCAPVRADAHDHRRLAAAMADRLQFRELVRKGKQPAAAFEEFAAKIGPEAVAQDRYGKLVDDHGEIIHLLAGQELRFVE
jgi:hypothetical protein